MNFNIDCKEVVNNMIFFTATLYVLDVTGVDQLIINAIGNDPGSTFKRSLASAVILESVVLLGNTLEDTGLNRLTTLLQ